MQNQGTTEQFLYDAAETKLREARLLYDNGFYEGAYYIGGYAVEFAFKALICRKLGFPFFVSKPGGSDESKGDYRSAVTKAFQTHDLGALLIFSGLYPKYKAEKDSQDGRALFRAWSSVSGWNENRRYEPLACDTETVDKFITSLEVIVAWIRSHY